MESGRNDGISCELGIRYPTLQSIMSGSNNLLSILVVQCYIVWYITSTYVDSHLRIPALKAMAFQIKRVTTSLGSAIIVLTFPLQRSERSQMPPVSSWHKVVGQDLIEFPNCPLNLSHGRNLQLCTHVVTNPLGKFRRRPTKNGTTCAIVVGDPLRPGIVVTRKGGGGMPLNRLMSSDSLPM